MNNEKGVSKSDTPFFVDLKVTNRDIICNSITYVFISMTWRTVSVLQV